MADQITYDPYTDDGLSARSAAAEASLKASGGISIGGNQELNFGYDRVASELRNMGDGPRFYSETPPEFVVEGSEETGYETRWLTPGERQAEHLARVAHNDAELYRYAGQIAEAESRLRTDIELSYRSGGAVDWQDQNEAIAQAQREAEKLPAYRHAKPLMTPVEGFLLSFFGGLAISVWGFGSLGLLAVGVMSILLAFIGTGLLFCSGAFAGMR